MQGYCDPRRRHLWPGSKSGVTVTHVKEASGQQAHTSTACSLAELVFEISRGQRGFGLGIRPQQTDLG